METSISVMKTERVDDIPLLLAQTKKMGVLRHESYVSNCFYL